MKSYKLILLVAVTCWATPGLADSESVSGDVMRHCVFPSKPQIPNGRTASEEEMIAAQKKIKAYMNGGSGYIDCLKKLESSWGEDVTDEQRQVIVIFHNKVVDDMEGVADLFNQAVRAFKGR